MTRKTTPAKKAAELRFPVRVRFAVPPSGFGANLDLMHDWLRLNLGPENHGWHGDNIPGVDATSLYCSDLAKALEFQEVFGLKLATLP